MSKKAALVPEKMTDEQLWALLAVRLNCIADELSGSHSFRDLAGLARQARDIGYELRVRGVQLRFDGV